MTNRFGSSNGRKREGRQGMRGTKKSRKAKATSKSTWKDTSNNPPNMLNYAPDGSESTYEHCHERPQLYQHDSSQSYPTAYLSTPANGMQLVYPQAHQMTPPNVPMAANTTSYASMLQQMPLDARSEETYSTSSPAAKHPSPANNMKRLKRSREDLNQREKERMSKLNNRISELRDVLDDAGIQTKKNKQSILDNAFYYIDMLRNNLIVAKQRATTAELQVQKLREQGTSTSDSSLAEVCFEQSVRPKMVVDVSWHPVLVNDAFLEHAGVQDRKALEGLSAEQLQAYISNDPSSFQKAVERAQTTFESQNVRVTTSKGHFLLIVGTIQGGYLEMEFVPLEIHAALG